jgi:hypothetical protein
VGLSKVGATVEDPLSAAGAAMDVGGTETAGGAVVRGIVNDRAVIAAAAPRLAADVGPAAMEGTGEPVTLTRLAAVSVNVPPEKVVGMMPEGAAAAAVGAAALADAACAAKADLANTAVSEGSCTGDGSRSADIGAGASWEWSRPMPAWRTASRGEGLPGTALAVGSKAETGVRNGEGRSCGRGGCATEPTSPPGFRLDSIGSSLPKGARAPPLDEGCCCEPPPRCTGADGSRPDRIPEPVRLWWGPTLPGKTWGPGPTAWFLTGV